MPRFQYKAKEGPVKVIDGFIESDNMDKAVQQIIKSGLTPIDIFVAKEEDAKASRAPKAAFGFIRRVGLKDTVIFTRQMSDLVEASVPILRALQIVQNQTENVHLKGMIERMYLFVRDGGSFSSALAQYPETFSGLYVNMVRTGEVGGKLPIVLRRLSDYLDKEQETRSKVRSSLAYPGLIFVVGVLTVFILLTFVIPRLSVMFEDLDQSLPMPTIILTNISRFFAQFWILIIAAVAIGAMSFRQRISTVNGRYWFDSLKLKMPLYGKFIKVVEVGRFSRTMGTLMESGVAITTALNSVWGTIDNVVLRDEIKAVSEEVSNGASLQLALKKCKSFPDMAINMISVGEETGHLEKGLYKIADTYEREADETIKTMIALLGPVVLVVIVAIVGFVVVAMLLPIFSMNLLIQ